MKRCRNCRNTKPLAAFSTRASGCPLNNCAECVIALRRAVSRRSSRKHGLAASRKRRADHRVRTRPADPLNVRLAAWPLLGDRAALVARLVA